MVKVSIIIAAYNIEDYIERCLISCMNQTFNDIEIVVVNDGSTDSTLERINKCTYGDSRVKIIDKKNAGLIEARKSGFEIAKGEYILFVDGDDWISLDTISVLYNKAKEKEYDIVSYKYLIKYEDGTEEEAWDTQIKTDNSSNMLKLLFSNNINHNLVTKFVKRSFIIDNKIEFPKSISYGEDLAFTYTLAMYNPVFTVIDECLYFYYKRSGSLDSNVNEKTTEITKALSFIKEQLIKNNIYKKYREEFEYMAYMQAYYVRKNYIFNNKNNISRSLFNNWRKLNININTKNNKFYKKLYDGKAYGKNNDKVLVVEEICKKSYFLGQLCYKVKPFIDKIIKVRHSSY
ncbi:MAG: glycosyltransferase family 2 protein [Romboutsia timonensis]|uniref:glycosyltransferase family 2 protein n=1 Tax=Romboutsia timonensis TaxID=1776391 RepID=UPI002A755454|nr:glycosyltransferase family 2 protein [Romboutsia timonensis]MDY2881479.1 glycosyltransferase family 2 protein [Romboutsia timonensis]